jgi:hypothetical protein
MARDRRTAIVVGALFILADFAGIPSLILWAPIAAAPDLLTAISGNENQLITSALLQLIMAAACAGIGITLYPVLRRHREALALGSTGFRLIESVFQMIGAMGLLVLLTLSRAFASAGTADGVPLSALGGLIVAGCDWVANVPVPLAWGLGALMYYYVFYRTRLVPRWLAGWGLVGIFGPLLAVILVMYGLIGGLGPAQLLLNLPIAVQELVLAVWLIVKGFNQSAISGQPMARETANEPRELEAAAA